MSSTDNARKRRRTPGVLKKLRAKTQSATIHITEEDDWETEVPNVKLSKVFAVVLLLHVIAVGGILAFQMFNSDKEAEQSGPATGITGGGETLGGPAIGGNPSRTGPVAGAPGARPSTTAAAARAATEPGVDMGPQGSRTYVVQTGDDIYAIARRLAISVEEIEKHNALDQGNPLRPGMRLTVPSREIAALRQPEVQEIMSNDRGETIQPDNKRETPGPRRGLAMKPDSDAAASIPSAAPVGALAPTSHSASVPSAIPAATPAAKPAPKPAPSTSTGATASAAASTPAPAVQGTLRIHEIQPGDTAYALGKKYGVPPDEILRFNNISDPSKLRPGQKLKIVLK